MSDVYSRIVNTLASLGEVKAPEATQRLMEYWSHGKGAAKIRWPERCAFCRCKNQLRKYVPREDELDGLCNHLEQRATGHPPNPEHSRRKHCPC